MAAIYDPEGFAARIDYAAHCFVRGVRNSRSFDTCFEMWDGDEVVTALVRRTEKNARLRKAIADSWGGTFPQSWLDTAAALAHVPRNRLADHARETRARRRREADEQAARWRAQQAAEIAAATAAR